MKRKLHWSVQLAVLLGFIGLFIIHLSLWLGVMMILVGLVVPIAVLWQSQRMTSSTPRTEMNKTHNIALPNRSLPRKVDRNKLGVLRYTLHQANLDSNKPVFKTKDNKTITVRDILVEMIEIADAHGQPIEALADDIVAMYPRIFENVDLALQQFPDRESAKAYIARKVMTEMGWKMEGEDLQKG